MRPGRATPAWTARDAAVLSFLGIAFLVGTYLLLRQNRTFLGRYPLAVPGVFFEVPRVRPYVLPLLLAAGVAAIVAAVRMAPALVRRYRFSIVAIYLLGVGLHFALLGSLMDGPFAMEKRTLSSRHGEYLVEAVSIDSLAATLGDYENWVRPHTYLSNKGPGILVFFYALGRVANAEPVRTLLEAVAPGRSTMRWWLAEFWFGVGPQEAERLRYLVALVFVVFPLLTMLPVFLVFWVGRAYAGAGFGLLAAALYPVVPAIGLLVAHLDYALFPLCTMAVVVPFAVGVSQKRPALIVASAAAFALYLTMTLAALSLAVLLFVYLALTVLQQLRQGRGIRRIALDAGTTAGTFALVSGVSLALFSVWAQVDLVERYRVARSIQQTWGGEGTGAWVVPNLLGYFLSFGLLQTAVLFVQQGRSLRRVVRAAADSIDHLTIGWLCLLVALVAFGRNHGETNRLWTFMSPLGCVIVARYLYDLVPARALWLPVAFFLAGLIASRYQLSYF